MFTKSPACAIRTALILAGVLVGGNSAAVADPSVAAASTRRPIIFLYNAGLPNGIDDQSTARYLGELLGDLDDKNAPFDIVNGGGGGPAITNERDKLDGLCQNKAENPIGVLVWQLYQQRSLTDYIIIHRYRTDAHLILRLYRCAGSGDTATAVPATSQVARGSDGSSNSCQS